MSESDDAWRRDAELNGWEIEAAPRWARLWGIRHVRYAISAWFVMRFDSYFRRLDLKSDGYEKWVLYAIWRGWK
jgi:hypothetical protein